jgi:hypothetical protein
MDKVKELLGAADRARGADRDRLLHAAGRAAGEMNQARMRAPAKRKRPGYRHGPRKHQAIGGANPDTFSRRGGMRALEYATAAEAAERAIERARRRWLPKLQAWHARLEDCPTRGFLAGEIRRLQRALHVSPTDEERRAQTRARVRRYVRRCAGPGPDARRAGSSDRTRS